jgi:hypothetical protein
MGAWGQMRASCIHVLVMHLNPMLMHFVYTLT